MEREVLVKKMIGKIEHLPINHIQELNDFIEFIARKNDDALLTKDLQQLTISSAAFDFLDNEPELYTINDLKVRFA
jgi:hypothetical protein